MSWQARIAILKARLRRDKEFYSNAEYMRRRYPAHQTADHVEPPQTAFTTNEITQTEIDGFPYYTLRPNALWSGLHIFYLHGGGFVEWAQDHQWHFAGWVAHTLRCKYSLFMYPLAPQHDHSTIVPSTLRAFDLPWATSHRARGSSSANQLAVASRLESLKNYATRDKNNLHVSRFFLPGLTWRWTTSCRRQSNRMTQNSVSRAPNRREAGTQGTATSTTRS